MSAMPSVPATPGPSPGELAPLIRVLLVEDDPGDAFLVGELFDEAHAPVSVEVVADLSSALDRLDTVDCVLLDLGVPDASGLDALRRLLSYAGTRVAV